MPRKHRATLNSLQSLTPSLHFRTLLTDSSRTGYVRHRRVRCLAHGPRRCRHRQPARLGPRLPQGVHFFRIPTGRDRPRELGLGSERRCNVFLRVGEAAVQAAVASKVGAAARAGAKVAEAACAAAAGGGAVPCMAEV